MKKILVCLMLVTYNWSFAQELDKTAFQTLITEAENNMRACNYIGALSKYHQALKISNYPSHHFYNAACAAALLGETDTAFNLLFQRLSVDKDWYSTHLSEDKDLLSLHADPRWKVLIDSLNVRSTLYENRYDRNLRAKLNDMFQTDQSIRNKYISARNQNEPDYVINRLVAQMLKVDSINQAEMSQLLDHYGWLDGGKVGDAAPIQFYILQHAPVAMQLRYREAVKRGLESGDIKTFQYAMFEDRIATQTGNKQIYGTQILFNESGDAYVAPCDNPAMVDSLRATVGLPPMSEHLQRWNLEWHY